jgi:Domain of unknown function (DUF6457)
MDAAPEASDVLRRLASALREAKPAGGDTDPLDLHDRALLLRIARDIAHATERQNAPLAAYLIGRYVQVRVTAGSSESEALAAAASTVHSLIGEAPA